MLVRMWENGTFVHCWLECKLVQPLWKTVWTFLKKTKNRTTIWCSNSTPGYIYPRKNKNKTLIWKDIWTPVFIAAIFIIAKLWKQPVSINRWMDKEDVIHTHTHTHTHNGILLCHKKEWKFTIYNNMDGLGGYYSKWNKSEKDKYHVILLISGI